MKRPENWKDLCSNSLRKLARDLLVWNCNQPVSDREHTEHYEQEIAPIHAEIDARWEAYWNKIDNEQAK